MNAITRTYRTPRAFERDLHAMAAAGYMPGPQVHTPARYGFLGRGMLWLCLFTFLFCFLFVGPFAIIPASFGLPFAWLLKKRASTTVIYQPAQYAPAAAPVAPQVTNNWFVMPPAAQPDPSMVDGAAYDVIGEARLLA